ncbi:MAG: hypothetical protein QF574_11520 [Arenicellales bacterium]|nr:hypothetical protein [Arenicellales bacterium]
MAAPRSPDYFHKRAATQAPAIDSPGHSRPTGTDEEREIPLGHTRCGADGEEVIGAASGTRAGSTPIGVALGHALVTTSTCLGHYDSNRSGCR